jgi:hypothetical protein
MRLLIYEQKDAGFELRIEREVQGAIDVTTINSGPSYAYANVCLSAAPLSVSADSKEVAVWLPEGCRYEFFEQRSMRVFASEQEPTCPPESLLPASNVMDKTEDSAKSSTAPQAVV